MTWHEQAACATHDPLMWETQNIRQTDGANAAAIAICRTCPVRTPCLNEALQVERGLVGRWHIFGGLMPDERARLDDGPRRANRKDRVA